MTLGFDFSRRYLVIGVYKDRDRNILRIYPLPFIRFTITWGMS